MSYGSSPSDPHEIYQYSYMPPQNYGHSYLTETGTVSGLTEETFWTNSPRTDSPSPNGQGPLVGPYQIYTPLNYPQPDHHRSQYVSGEYEYTTTRNPTGGHPPFVRVVKRRTTANKKERRRTMSINNAYSDLRDCIPNVPADTKLSKIKTLRLATSYISYLTGVLETDEPAGGFKAELVSTSRKSASHHQHHPHLATQNMECAGKMSPKCEITEEMMGGRRTKGRTGWPQHVWALELKQEQTL